MVSAERNLAFFVDRSLLSGILNNMIVEVGASSLAGYGKRLTPIFIRTKSGSSFVSR